MYIKSIVIDGFKSYGQRTEINGFDPLFNAITGLNGTGKSNILDSICFVLGISNLTHVRANNLQDLIFKNGQSGVQKASVSIKFDNRNPAQCPPGYENTDEITITRQIALGGKNKYMVNGINVTPKKVQDFFCSIQLNVNNPHFLIMQGRITKVLNMKPQEVLSMVEEAAGTKMYEIKRQQTQKLIDKKDARLSEIKTVINDELAPKLQKLKAEREEYLEYQRIDRELQHLMGIFLAWQYFEAKRNLTEAEQALANGELKINSFKDEIQQNIRTTEQLDKDIQEINAKNQSDASKELQNVEAELKETTNKEISVSASVKSIKENIAAEDKKKKLLEKGIINNEKVLKDKENGLSKVQSLFEQLKENDRVDGEAVDLAEQKYQALCAGMEVNDEGEAETLAEQLMNVKNEALRATTECNEAKMQLQFCEKELKAKSSKANLNSSTYERDKSGLEKVKKEIANLEASLARLNYSEDRMMELNTRRRTLEQEKRSLHDRIENFYATRPYISFKYSDPEPNFDKSHVKGVVCRLFECKDNTYATALETAGGGRLYNVAVDTETTGKKLLANGNLRQRTTFIPLNKISARTLVQQTINFAQNLVGKENCQPALSLIKYEKAVQPAIEYIFGEVFACKDIKTAKTVTFHNKIRKRCVTLEGDSTDPSGTLSGGAKQKGEPILPLIREITKLEIEYKLKVDESVQLQHEAENMSQIQDQYNSLKKKLDFLNNDLRIGKQRLLNTDFGRDQDELENLNRQLGELKQKITICRENEEKFKKKAKDLEVKIQDSEGYREKQLKQAESDLKKAKSKAERSKQEWQKRKHEYETLTLEIEELKNDLEESRKALQQTEDEIKNLNKEYEQASENLKEIQERVKILQTEVNRMVSEIAEKNKEVQSKVRMKEKLIAQNTELELKIKKYGHEIKELTAAHKTSKHREQEYAKKMVKNDDYLKRGEALTQNEGRALEMKIKVSQQKKQKLGKTINPQAQSMFDTEEKRYNEMWKKQNIVKGDRAHLVKTMQELDTLKENALKLAIDQVSKDFGSIFSTVLPGANCKLVPQQGKSILGGLEIKVSLGNVWKENLTELSGGQRSLAALSLILAMLLFKPAPLYILDEVDAALDLSHTQNIGYMLKTHFKKSQFIVVSLKDGMFSNANVLFRTRFIDGVSSIQRTENRSNR
ncbi:hypothetical protein ABEB36_006156 [Hypothenemus hampei]|uniref:Structural maintenance of chromosomes protein n=1 Tax=Hypothenemus hampei TaxID=57062 RepID=A0ABD1F0P1_HYPHA